MLARRLQRYATLPMPRYAATLALHSRWLANVSSRVITWQIAFLHDAATLTTPRLMLLFTLGRRFDRRFTSISRMNTVSTE